MPAEFLKGDLFAHGLSAFAHGCNCAGALGAGIAVEFRRRWPRMFDEYRARCDDKRLALGDVLVWSEGDTTVYNLAIQEHWRHKAQLSALAKSLRRMVRLAEDAGVARIGMPRIGAGFGGLDWPRVRKQIEQIAAETRVELVVFEGFIPAARAG